MFFLKKCNYNVKDVQITSTFYLQLLINGGRNSEKIMLLITIGIA